MLPQAKEFKKRWQDGAGDGVCEDFVVKKELSRKAKLSVHWSVCVPTLTCGCELCVVTERTRLEQGAKRRFLQRVAGQSLRLNLTKLLWLICLW